MTEQPTDPAPVVEPGVQPAVAMVGLTPVAQQYLDQTRPWVRFMSVFSFLTAGFMFVAGLGLLAISVVGGVAGLDRGGMGALGPLGLEPEVPVGRVGPSREPRVGPREGHLPDVGRPAGEGLPPPEVPADQDPEARRRP